MAEGEVTEDLSEFCSEYLTESEETSGKLCDKDKFVLLESLKEYPCLWNTSIPSYKDKLKKVEASRQLASKFKINADELRKVLHSLRTSMTREIKRTQQTPSYVSRWKFFKSMDYLKDEILKSLNPEKPKSWTDNENEIIIKYYKENEFLWNHHLRDYKNRDKREIAMSKLQEELPNRSTQEIKSQWHALKTVFDREHGRVEGSKRSGAGTDSVYNPTWKHFKSMQFTKQCQNLDESTSTLTCTSDSLEDEPQPPSGTTVKTAKKKKTSKSGEVSDIKIELWREAIDVLKSGDHDVPVPEVKELRSFGKMIEETLTRFNQRQRAVAKKRIGDVLFEVEMGETSMPRGHGPWVQQQHFWSETPQRAASPQIQTLEIPHQHSGSPVVQVPHSDSPRLQLWDHNSWGSDYSVS